MKWGIPLRKSIFALTKYYNWPLWPIEVRGTNGSLVSTEHRDARFESHQSQSAFSSQYYTTTAHRKANLNHRVVIILTCSVVISSKWGQVNPRERSKYKRSKFQTQLTFFVSLPIFLLAISPTFRENSFGQKNLICSILKENLSLLSSRRVKFIGKPSRGLTL